jgi:hypothetical protein
MDNRVKPEQLTPWYLKPIFPKLSGQLSILLPKKPWGYWLLSFACMIGAYTLFFWLTYRSDTTVPPPSSVRRGSRFCHFRVGAHCYLMDTETFQEIGSTAPSASNGPTTRIRGI